MKTAFNSEKVLFFFLTVIFSIQVMAFCENESKDPYLEAVRLCENGEYEKALEKFAFFKGARIEYENLDKYIEKCSKELPAYRRALELAKEGKHCEAKDILKDLYAKYPFVALFRAALLTELVSIASAEPTGEVALKMLLEAEKLAPSDVDNLAWIGRIYLERGDMELAFRYLDRANNMFFDTTSAARYQLARFFVKKKAFDKAKKLLLRIAIDEPADPEITGQIAQVALELGEKDSYVDFRLLSLLYGSNESTAEVVAEIEKKAGVEKKEIERRLDKLIPVVNGLLQAPGKIERDLFEEAVSLARAAKAVSPGIPFIARIFFEVGQALQDRFLFDMSDRKKLYRSIEYLGSGLELFPDYIPGRLYLASALLLNGNAPEALKILQADVSKIDKWPYFHFLKGKALVELGRFTEAIKEFEIAREIAGEVEMRNRAMSILMGLGNMLPARAVAEWMNNEIELAERLENDTVFRISRMNEALFAARNEEYRKSIEIYESLLADCGTSACSLPAIHIRLMLASVLLLEGNVDRARKEFQNILEEAGKYPRPEAVFMVGPMTVITLDEIKNIAETGMKATQKFSERLKLLFKGRKYPGGNLVGDN